MAGSDYRSSGPFFGRPLTILDAVEVTAFRRCKPVLKKGGLRGEPSLTTRPLALWSEEITCRAALHQW